ncbi:hypothetical protein ACIRUL_14750 [Streptomyces sp. NPDC101171]|uniref:hypothetical protein n=1 Tax=Streptomyces sp. NPDC101171 TaxID=3366122 RepID=UPI0038277FC3
MHRAHEYARHEHACAVGRRLGLATSDILPEAHSSHPSRATPVFTVAGAAFMLLVIRLTG